MGWTAISSADHDRPLVAGAVATSIHEGAADRGT